MFSSLSSTQLARCLTLVIGLGLACAPAVVAQTDTSRAVVAQTDTKPDPAPAPCAGMVALDDGSVESGYGFVPSATIGTYVQAFDSSDLPGPYLTGVCLCFMKTRDDHDIDFEVVVYADQGGKPAAQPIAAIPASQKGVAPSKEEAGEFVEVSMPDVLLPTGTVYVGARWDPSLDRFLFLCNDQTDVTPKTRVYFAEDKTPTWTSVEDARDPIFKPHRAVMVRVRTSKKPVEDTAAEAESASPPPE